MCPAGDPILASDYTGIRKGTIDRIMCRLVASGTQSLAAGGTAITFTGEDYDPDGLHNAVSNTARITPTRAGYYTFTGLSFISSTANVLATWLRKNGTTTFASGQREGTPSAATQRGELATATVFMNGSTDYMELICDPGATLNTNQSLHFSSMFECRYTGRLQNP